MYKILLSFLCIGACSMTNAMAMTESLCKHIGVVPVLSGVLAVFGASASSAIILSYTQDNKKKMIGISSVVLSLCSAGVALLVRWMIEQMDESRRNEHMLCNQLDMIQKLHARVDSLSELVHKIPHVTDPLISEVKRLSALTENHTGSIRRLEDSNNGGLFNPSTRNVQPTDKTQLSLTLISQLTKIDPSIPTGERGNTMQESSTENALPGKA